MAKSVHDKCLLINVLRDLHAIEKLTLKEWDLLIRQARRADLLGRLAVLLHESGLLNSITGKPREHLVASLAFANKHRLVMQWEIECINRALSSLSTPVIYLKGAAYVLRDLPAARGRIYSDVDIMVPRSELLQAEKLLMIHGWTAIKLDAYDQRYYREWMHEIPPLRHRRRATVIDVHHRILPETTRAQPDPENMMAVAEPANENERIKTLAPVDMVLHSAVHLFYEGEFDHGLRDIVDLDDLFRYYASDISFWQGFIDRAVELQQEMPAYYAMRYCAKILNTPVPREVFQYEGIWRPGYFRKMLMDFLFLRVLTVEHQSCDRWGSKLARFILYVRSHYLRMPFYLLIPHLIRKAVRRDEDSEL